MTPELEALMAQRAALVNQIANIMAMGASASASDLALLKAYRRQFQSVTAQIVILVNTPPPDEIPF